MWRGYILFNQARLTFIEYAFANRTADEVVALMEAAIDARATLNELIADILAHQDELSVLQRHYLYQEEYARQLHVNYCLVLGKEAVYRGERVEAIDEAYLARLNEHNMQLRPKNRDNLANLQR